MTTSNNVPFIPILTVMVDYGNAPFLWLVDNPDRAGVGSNLCDGVTWDESFPMSEGLWQKFSDWAIKFDRTSFYSDDFDAQRWDWPAFHAHGLQLTRWLKEEIGDAYRVVYMKPCEDPECQVDERRDMRVMVPWCCCLHFDTRDEVVGFSRNFLIFPRKASLLVEVNA